MKLQRAEEHFGDLLAEQTRFHERNPYRMLREDDPEAGENHFLWRAKIVEHPPYEKWASLIGECVHSLRCALDHTAYALVNTPQFVSDMTEFPIFYDRAPVDADYAKKLPLVRPEVVAEVERLQPYGRGNETHPLALVHLLDIIDKHRRLNLVNATVDGTVWHASRGELVDIDYGLGAFVDGAVVGRYGLVPDANGEMAVKTHFAFGIAIAKGEPGQGQSASQMLEYLRSFVGGIVTRFERFL
jgi:hypothetical protein